jgi:hypothetical protein
MLSNSESEQIEKGKKWRRAFAVSVVTESVENLARANSRGILLAHLIPTATGELELSVP